MNIEEIKKDYKVGLKYDEITKKHNITKNQLIYLIRKHKWKRKSNRSKSQKGNQNALGNKGGTGAELENKRALKTGEYENIFSGFFSEEENDIYKNKDFSNVENNLKEEIALLTIRERRMLERIDKLKNGDNMQPDTATQMKTKGNTTIILNSKNKLTEIQNIEEALTRIQKTKANCIARLHRIQIETDKDFDNDIQIIIDYGD